MGLLDLLCDSSFSGRSLYPFDLGICVLTIIAISSKLNPIVNIWPFPAYFSLFLSFLESNWQISTFKISRLCRCWDSNRRSLISEATALPTAPQPQQSLTAQSFTNRFEFVKGPAWKHSGAFFSLSFEPVPLQRTARWCDHSSRKSRFRVSLPWIEILDIKDGCGLLTDFRRTLEAFSTGCNDRGSML